MPPKSGFRYLIIFMFNIINHILFDSIIHTITHSYY